MVDFIEIYYPLESYVTHVSHRILKDKIETKIISNINIAHMVLMIAYVRELKRSRFDSEYGHFFIHFFYSFFF